MNSWFDYSSFVKMNPFSKEIHSGECQSANVLGGPKAVPAWPAKAAVSLLPPPLVLFSLFPPATHASSSNRASLGA